MKTKQKNQILNSLYAAMYGTGLTVNFIVLFRETLETLDKGIGYSPYCKTKILIQMISSAKSIDQYCMTIQEQESFEQTIRKVYLE